MYGELSEDATYAYYLDSKTSEVAEIVIDFPLVEASGCLRPIIVTTHISDFYHATVLIEECNTCNKTENFGKRYTYYEYKLKTRHERFGASEVVTAYAHRQTALVGGPYPYILKYPLPNVHTVKKNDINKNLQRWVGLSNNGDPSYFLRGEHMSICNTLWNVVENDSWVSPKRVLTMKFPNGQEAFLNLRRTWTSDWFAFDPYNTSWDYTCDHQVDWGTKWRYSPHADFRVWRIEN